MLLLCCSPWFLPIIKSFSMFSSYTFKIFSHHPLLNDSLPFKYLQFLIIIFIWFILQWILHLAYFDFWINIMTISSINWILLQQFFVSFYSLDFLLISFSIYWFCLQNIHIIFGFNQQRHNYSFVILPGKSFM